ncbi:MAG TPA: Na+/H+ antiporter subunit C [Balneolaceae bacterium]|nr:Na+/H+ antiporter subunit C [Balneolaceae bacterium]
METLLAIVSGAIFAASIFLILRKNLIRVTIGIVLITNATNLTIFTVGRLTSANPPFIKEGATTAAPGIANSLPQALILTCIVIGFGLLSFALILIYRHYKATLTVVTDEMAIAEPLFSDRYTLLSEQNRGEGTPSPENEEGESS